MPSWTRPPKSSLFLVLVRGALLWPEQANPILPGSTVANQQIPGFWQSAGPSTFPDDVRLIARFISEGPFRPGQTRIGFVAFGVLPRLQTEDCPLELPVVRQVFAL